MRPRQPTALIVLFSLSVAAAGCTSSESQGPDGPGGPGALGDDSDSFLIDGLVIDTEILPIEGARVTLEPLGLVTNSTSAGVFRFGPISQGDYTIRVEKQGYAPATREMLIAQTAPERVAITLTPVASTVPYHVTHTYAAYIMCTLNALVFAPCVPVNVLTGQNVTEDRAEFNFRVPSPGLVDLLHEMIWRPQATGHDMAITIRDPSLAVVAGGVTVIYAANSGGPGLRTWVVTGIVNEDVGGTHVFEATEGKPYTAIIRASTGNSTTPGAAVFIDHRVENYFTFFYNRAGPRDFTVIPDA